MTAVVEQFNAAKTLAEGRRQQQLSQAREKFSTLRAVKLALHRRAYADAAAAFEKVKILPAHPKHDEAKRALDIAGRDFSDKDLRSQLDGEIGRIDATYRADVLAAAARLGIHSS
jgi:multidrug resistance efflux pump